MSSFRRAARLTLALSLAAVSVTCNGDNVTRPEESAPALATTGTPATLGINRQPPASALDQEVWGPTLQPIVVVKDAGGVVVPGVVVTASIVPGTGTLQGTLTVRRQLVVEDPGSRVRVKPPKSHNGVRTLLLDPATLDLLGPVAAGPASRYLFTGRTGQPIRPDNLTDRFNQLAEATKVRPIGPHQIRHRIASTLLDAGYGVHEVAERLGHDPATLMRYYTRVNATRRLQATDRIAELMTAFEVQPRSPQTGVAAPRVFSLTLASPWRCAPAEARKVCIRIQATAGGQAG